MILFFLVRKVAFSLLLFLSNHKLRTMLRFTQIHLCQKKRFYLNKCMVANYHTSMSLIWKISIILIKIIMQSDSSNCYIFNVLSFYLLILLIGNVDGACEMKAIKSVKWSVSISYLSITKNQLVVFQLRWISQRIERRHWTAHFVQNKYRSYPRRGWKLCHITTIFDTGYTSFR